jgi:hypothetical protein
MYHAFFAQMSKQLGQIDTWLDAATTFAESKKFSPDLFLTFRLAPDQFALARQLQIACDTAKLGVSRLTGKDAPAHADTEQTLAEFRARVASVRAYLAGFTAADFADTATRLITQPRWEGKTMTGADYFIEHVVPNFNFHLTTAYAILRHNGVPVGKRDYLGALTMKDPA